MGQSRSVVMQVVKRSSTGSQMHHVEFTLDASFCDRLRQLRSLVPPLTSLNKQRDLVIDKVRVRLPSAVWRCDGEVVSDVEGSCVVVSGEGLFNCGGKDCRTKEKLVTYTFPIARLLELHAERAPGETFYIRNGVFTNDEPATSSAGQWNAAMHLMEGARAADNASDFDTLQGMPLRSVAPLGVALQ